MSMFVKFWGTRGSIPTPGWQTRTYGGNTPCVTVQSGKSLIICDAGTGIRPLGQTLMLEAGGTPVTAHLLFSHPHWDHIQGFPFFVPAYIPNNRLFIYGKQEGDCRLFNLLSGQMRSDYFPVAFHAMAAGIAPRYIGAGCAIGDVQVRWFDLRHPGGSLAYRFEKNGTSVVYATDSELDLGLRNTAEVTADPGVTRYVDEDYLRFVHGADLLIADGQYTDEEYPSKINWGHSRCTTAVDAAIAAGVKRLAIFHHDPMHSDQMIDKIVATCVQRARLKNSELVVFGAREGVELLIR